MKGSAEYLILRRLDEGNKQIAMEIITGIKDFDRRKQEQPIMCAWPSADQFKMLEYVHMNMCI